MTKEGRFANRRQEREYLIRLVEQGPWYERLWLPLLRLVHRRARASDERQGVREVLVVLVGLCDDDELEALEDTLEDHRRYDALAVLRSARREMEAEIESYVAGVES